MHAELRAAPRACSPDFRALQAAGVPGALRQMMYVSAAACAACVAAIVESPHLSIEVSLAHELASVQHACAEAVLRTLRSAKS